MENIKNRPLKICLLCYRNDPFCGGQGVYIDNLSKSLVKIGHTVDIISGPPKIFFEKLPIHKINSLDLYNKKNLFKVPNFSKLLNLINFFEWLNVSTMSFPEPYIFGLKCLNHLDSLYKKYDVIHDNQCLSYGILRIHKIIPTVVTIHHPITKDMRISIKNAKSLIDVIRIRRWYGFVNMQKHVSKNVCKIITVSGSSMNDIINDFGVSRKNIDVIYNGVDTEIFRPLRKIKKNGNIIITTCGTENPMKGLKYLFIATSYIRHICKTSLIVVGKRNSSINVVKMLGTLDIFDLVHFTGEISNEELVVQYNKSTLAVIPSIYEGFGFPAIEAMACGVPVIGTTGGSLAEVIGDAGILVPPKNYLALSYAIIKVLNNHGLSSHMSRVGRLRVKSKFSWTSVAKKTIKCYTEVIN